MNDSAWHWARLDRKGIALVQETESALGADFVLAYGPGGPVADASTLAGLAPVALTESELECLQGVESKLGVVAVAYSRAHWSRPQFGRTIDANAVDDTAILAIGQDYSYAGETLSVLGRYEEAVANFEREIRLYDRLVEAAGAHELAGARRIHAGYFLASIDVDRGELEAARQRLAALDASVRKQLSLSEDDTRLRETLVAVLRERTVVEAALGERQRALELANTAREASGLLSARDSDNLLWQSYRAGALTTRARLRK